MIPRGPDLLGAYIKVYFGWISFWYILWVSSWSTEAENHMFFKNVWKLCQKMRLDAVIIFPIDWRQEELLLRGWQLKYWGRTIFFSTNMRIDAVIIFLIDWRQEEFMLMGKQSKYRGQQINIKAKQMRRDAVISLCQEELI